MATNVIVVGSGTKAPNEAIGFEGNAPEGRAELKFCASIVKSLVLTVPL